MIIFLSKLLCSCRSSARGIAPWLWRKYSGLQSKIYSTFCLHFSSHKNDKRVTGNTSRWCVSYCFAYSKGKRRLILYTSVRNNQSFSSSISVRTRTSSGYTLSPKLGIWIHLRRWLRVPIQKIPMKIQLMLLDAIIMKL